MYNIVGNAWSLNAQNVDQIIFDGKVPVPRYGLSRAKCLLLGGVFFPAYCLLPELVARENIKFASSAPLDNCPGGFFNVPELIADSDTKGMGEINTNADNTSFIPTISALDYDTNNFSFNVSADANSVSKTPFDTIYFPEANEKHVDISVVLRNRMLQELVPKTAVIGQRENWNSGNVFAQHRIVLKACFKTDAQSGFHAQIKDLQVCATSTFESSARIAFQPISNSDTIDENVLTKINHTWISFPILLQKYFLFA